MKRLILAAVLIMLLAGKAFAQGGVECMVCQLVLGMVESSAGDGKDICVDASRQCSLLPEGDREACVKFYASTGPKFIKVIKARTAKGESLEDICKTMGYCGQ